MEKRFTTVSYYEALYKVCKKLGLKLNNNHAFRIALNSYVYVPMGLPVTERRTEREPKKGTLKLLTFRKNKRTLNPLNSRLSDKNC